MFKRLMLLVLFVVATLSVSTPAHAHTITVSLTCTQTSGGQSVGTFFCWVHASGGIGSTTIHWYEYAASTGYFLVKQESGTTYSEYDSWCQTNVLTRIRVVVTDSTGTQGESIKSVKCGNPY